MPRLHAVFLRSLLAPAASGSRRPPRSDRRTGRTRVALDPGSARPESAGSLRLGFGDLPSPPGKLEVDFSERTSERPVFDVFHDRRFVGEDVANQPSFLVSDVLEPGALADRATHLAALEFAFAFAASFVQFRAFFWRVPFSEDRIGSSDGRSGVFVRDFLLADPVLCHSAAYWITPGGTQSDCRRRRRMSRSRWKPPPG